MGEGCAYVFFYVRLHVCMGDLVCNCTRDTDTSAGKYSCFSLLCMFACVLGFVCVHVRVCMGVGCVWMWGAWLYELPLFTCQVWGTKLIS